MPAVIGALRAELSAGIGQFASDMTKAGTHVDRLSAKFKGLDRVMPGASRGLQGFAKGLFSVQGIIGTLAGTGGIGLLVKNALATADTLVKVADAAGVSTAFLQEMRFAATQSGLSVEQFDAALTGLTKRVGELRSGKGDLLAMLKKLEPALLQQVRTAGTTEQAYNLITAAADKFSNASERNAFLAAAFGRTTGVVMANLVKDQAKLRQAARDMGLVFDEAMIRKAEAAGDKIAALYAMLSARVTVAILDNAGAIERLAEGLTKLAMVLVNNAQTFGSAMGAGILGFLFGGPAGALAGAGAATVLSELDRINTLLAERAKQTASIVERLQEVNAQLEAIDNRTARNVGPTRRAALEAERVRLIEQFERNQAAAMPAAPAAGPATGGGTAFADDDDDKAGKTRAAGLKMLTEMVDKLREEAIVLGTVASGREAMTDLIQAQSIAIEHNIDVTSAEFQVFLTTLQERRAALDQLKAAEEAETKVKEHQKEVEAAWAAVVQANLTPLEAYNAAIEELNKLRDESIKLGADAAAVEETYGRAVAKSKDVLAEADGTAERLREMEGLGREFGRTLADSLRDVATGFENLAAVAEDMLSRIADKMFDVLVSSAFEDLFGSLFKGALGGSSLGSFPGLLFGGALAGGGDVLAGRSYVVGEEGPELFRPNSSGMIEPAGSWGGGPMIGAVNIQTPDVHGFMRSRMEVANAIGAAATTAGARGR